MKKTTLLFSLSIVMTSAYACGSFNNNGDYDEYMTDHVSFTLAHSLFAPIAIQSLPSADREHSPSQTSFTMTPEDSQFLPRFNNQQTRSSHPSAEDELVKRTEKLSIIPRHKAASRDFLTQPRTNHVLTPDQVTQMLKRQTNMQRFKEIINKKRLAHSLQTQVTPDKSVVNNDPSC